MIELWAIGVLVLVAGCYLYKADFAQYSIFTVGVFKRVYRYESKREDIECAENYCESGTLEGEIRKATKEIVLFGCPVFRRPTAVNYYCPDHTSFEFQQGAYGVARTERVTESLLSALVAWYEFKPQVESDSQLTEASDDVVSGMNAAVSLLPVVVLVLVIASFMGVAKTLRGT